MLARQFLPNDIGIAVVAEKPFARPIVQAIKRRSQHRLAIPNSTTFAKVAANRVANTAKLLRNPLPSQDCEGGPSP